MKRPGAGRRIVPEATRRGIVTRLRGFIDRRWPSVHAFKNGDPPSDAPNGSRHPPFGEKTVDGWLYGKRVPDTAMVLRLAQETGLSPNYLLLGVGDPLHEHPEALATALRRRVHDELVAAGRPATVVDDLLPAASNLLAEVVASYATRATRRESHRARGDRPRGPSAMRPDAPVDHLHKGETTSHAPRRDERTGDS